MNIPELLVLGVPITVLVPLGVEQAKTMGMPTKLSGLASMIIAFCVVLLVETAKGTGTVSTFAGFLLAGFVFGLAGSGAYSQVKMLTSRTS